MHLLMAADNSKSKQKQSIVFMQAAADQLYQTRKEYIS